MTAAELERAHEAALQSLARNPDDVDALRAAGRTALELGAPDALDHLRRAVEIVPDDAAAWYDLGIALVDRGQPADAVEAFGKAVRLRPDDVATLIDLAHTSFAIGRVDDGIALLEQVVERDPGNAAVLRSLLEMHRSAGRSERALAAAQQVASLDPADALAALDVAELNLDLGRSDDAIAAFNRLRAIDTEPEHEVYAYHGMIEAEARRDGWRRALDLAVEATRVDRYGRTTDLLAFAVAQVFGEGGRRAPERADVDASLAASRGEHRRLHTETVVV
jgi:tetratricopeptide (TPR) repeat protein